MPLHDKTLDYVIFFFSTTKQAVETALGLADHKDLKFKLEKVPRATVNIEEYCNLGIITTKEYEALMSSELETRKCNYQIFAVDCNNPKIKPFVMEWEASGFF